MIIKTISEIICISKLHTKLKRNELKYEKYPEIIF